ncbi:MAG: BLUF domain-containing protein [Pseudomonadota bacterium]
MIRLLYFSTARGHVGTAEVDDIVAHASQKNEALGITGALAYNGRNFCQLLEGEEGAVMGLLQEIEADPRHGGFKLLDQKEILKRHFPDWSMRRVRDLDFSVVINAMHA